MTQAEVVGNWLADQFIKQGILTEELAPYFLAGVIDKTASMDVIEIAAQSREVDVRVSDS